MYNYNGGSMKRNKKLKLKYKFRRLLVLIVLLLIIFIPVLKYIKGADIRKLKSIGYTSQEISYIKDKDVSIKTLKKYDYITNLKELVDNKNYKSENLSKYLDVWSKDKSTNTIIIMVNNNIKYPYDEKIASIIDNKYFILKNLDRYMSYEEEDTSKIVTNVNCNLDKEFYTDQVDSDTSDGMLLIVNKYYSIPDGYNYGELVTLDKAYSVNSNDKLSKETYEAFKELVEAAEKEGLHIRSKSAYRSYETQKNLYNNYKKTNGYNWAEKWSAHPGNSEHQTGLALDVCSKDTYTIQKFEGTNEFNWMKDNSYKYGFILRYPEGKEYITGYNYEPWHYRYVGKDIAKYIYENNITFEEYWAYFVDNK